MNTNNIKRYAPKARTAFIAAMTKRAALFGIRESSIPSMGIEPLEQKGDLALIGDRPFPASIIRPRAALVKKVEQIGFAQAMEQAAYSWFNRLCAIRYMELKGYLDHGRRVLSHPEQPSSFQILDDCLDIELEGLDRQRIAELKLDGTKDEELYHELLLAQCHALHKAMPFLFEAVDDATELLLPDNLTKTDSLIRELVSAIPEEDWQEVEIIGWLYQFYIAEKKDQIIGKVVKSEDIPAATQLFTPNWIVQYLVQNSVGRQWLLTYPDAPLKAKMSYYIEPAEQTPEVQTQLASITPDSIDPLSIKVLDPACGSGHILVEAYKVLKGIYEERGHRTRDIPQLILENNLFGLDIDDRAGQLAGFALMMLAREDDRRIFSREVKLNVLSLQEASHVDLAKLWQALNLSSDWQRGQSQSLFDSEQTDLGADSADNRYQLLKTTLARFTQAKTFGSLIEVPAEDAEPLAGLLEQLRQMAREGDVMQKPAAEQLISFVQQAWVLALRYDAVIANPPYMGSGYFNSDFKSGIKSIYKASRTDLYVIFIERNIKFLRNKTSLVAMITRQDWMFTSSYSDVRNKLVHECMLHQLIHLGAGAFPSISGEVVQAAMYTYSSAHIDGYQQTYIDCSQEKNGKEASFFDLSNRYVRNADFFPQSMGSPILYQLSPEELKSFALKDCFDGVARLREGIHTGDNGKYVKSWWEVDFENISFSSENIESFNDTLKRYAPYNKGGTTTRWYENTEFVVAFDSFSREEMKKIQGHVRPSQTLYFKEGGTWSDVATRGFGVRFFEKGHLFDGAGPIIISKDLYCDIGVMNSLPFRVLAGYAMPNLHFKCGTVKKMPYPPLDIGQKEKIKQHSKTIIEDLSFFSKSKEIYWSFKCNALITNKQINIRESIETRKKNLEKTINDISEREREIDIIVSNAYGLNADLYSNAGTKNLALSNDLNGEFFDLISYSIGCILGRYSLSREGLVYANSGNQGFAELAAEGAYNTFPADSDGILPLTDQEWFTDDATNRIREFVSTVWGHEHLQENLDFIAASLCLYTIKSLKGKSGGESALDTIRRYLSTQFYKDHLKTYKKRPIYWLFSSGKHKAFECLVYLHRYNEGTLARMRTEYVIPLTAKLNTYANKLATDIENETVTSEKNRLEKELAALHNQQAELATFDEKLRHRADQRINLDLDEGVKANYGKFGDLLAEVKAITGGATE